MSYSELSAMTELLSMLFINWRIGMLVVLLLLAAVIDYRTRRIPNWLTLFGTLFGVMYNMAFPPFLHASTFWPFEGLALGLIVFMPLYMMGVMGAGDVKLMAMVGAIVGPMNTIWVLLYTMVVGGLLSILFVLAHGSTGRMLRNLIRFINDVFFNTLNGDRPNFRIGKNESAGELPYGIAIAIGTIGYLAFHQLGFL